jgi:hypothetical protein
MTESAIIAIVVGSVVCILFICIAVVAVFEAKAKAQITVRRSTSELPHYESRRTTTTTHTIPVDDPKKKEETP